MRGKDVLEGTAVITARGSPPLARERLSQYGGIHTGRRITPACAGKTRTSVPVYVFTRDHPRLRGKD